MVDIDKTDLTKMQNILKLNIRYFAIKTFLDHFQNTSSSFCQTVQTSLSFHNFPHHTPGFKILLCLLTVKCGDYSNLNTAGPYKFILIKDAQENKAFILHRSLAL